MFNILAYAKLADEDMETVNYSSMHAAGLFILVCKRKAEIAAERAAKKGLSKRKKNRKQKNESDNS